jgi:hypothetical protein
MVPEEKGELVFTTPMKEIEWVDIDTTLSMIRGFLSEWEDQRISTDKRVLNIIGFGINHSTSA